MAPAAVASISWRAAVWCSPGGGVVPLFAAEQPPYPVKRGHGNTQEHRQVACATRREDTLTRRDENAHGDAVGIQQAASRRRVVRR